MRLRLLVSSLPETLDRIALGLGHGAYFVLVPLAWLSGGLLFAALLTRVFPFLVSTSHRRAWESAASRVGSFGFLIGFLATIAGVVGAIGSLDSVLDEGFAEVGAMIGFALRTTAVGIVVTLVCELAAWLLEPKDVRRG